MAKDIETTEAKTARKGTQVSCVLNAERKAAFERVYAERLVDLFKSTGRTPKTSDLLIDALDEYLAKYDTVDTEAAQ